jgi:hypothetical protein
VQVDESVLEALLGDVFCVFPVTREASRNGQNPSLVTYDENFKCVWVSVPGGKDERHFRAPTGYALSLRFCKLARRTTPPFHV